MSRNTKKTTTTEKKTENEKKEKKKGSTKSLVPKFVVVSKRNVMQHNTKQSCHNSKPQATLIENWSRSLNAIRPKTTKQMFFFCFLLPKIRLACRGLNKKQSFMFVSSDKSHKKYWEN